MSPSSPDRVAIIARLRAAGCVFAEEEADLLLRDATNGAGDVSLEERVTRRVAGEPLEHILGWVGFAGLRLAVAPGVFVPRRRTELLAREAAAFARPGAVVLDLCCGCGAIGAAVRAAVPDIELYAVDIDPAALECARRNLPGADIRHGDLFEPLPAQLRGGVDLVVANVPYVPEGAIAMLPPEARDHEPRLALQGGADGLDVARRVAAGARAWLRPGGHVLIETSTEQEPALRAAFIHNGLTPRSVEDDDLGATIVVAQLDSERASSPR